MYYLIWRNDFIDRFIYRNNFTYHFYPSKRSRSSVLYYFVFPRRLLNIACAAKARTRNVTLARPSRDEVLHFSILGGYERGFGIFISKVDKKSRAEDVGLKRGDQILEVNGQSFEHVSHSRALEILRSSTHLSITVKSNLLGES